MSRSDDLYLDGGIPDGFFGPDLSALQAREALRLSDEWEVFRWEQLHGQAIQVTLGIPTLITSGPKKGQKKWDRKAARVFICSNAEWDAWRERWSQLTGNCLKCRGSGRECRGWSRDRGTRYRVCRRCKGTGKRQEDNRGKEE